MALVEQQSTVQEDHLIYSLIYNLKNVLSKISFSAFGGS